MSAVRTLASASASRPDGPGRENLVLNGNVSLDSFGERYDSELANDLGNLVSRTTAMIARYR